MKKYILILAVLPLLLNSCVKELQTARPDGEGQGEYLVLRASIGADTKVVREYEDSKVKSAWEVGDKVLCWFGDVTASNASTPVEFVCSDDNGEKIFISSSPVEVSAGQTVYAVASASDEAQAQLKSQSYTDQTGTDFSASQLLTASGEVSSTKELSLSFNYISSFLRLNLSFPETVSAGAEVSNITIAAVSGLSEKYVLDLVSKTEAAENSVPVRSLKLNGKGTLDTERKLDVFVSLPPRTIEGLSVSATVGENVYTQDVVASFEAAGGRFFSKSGLEMQLVLAPEITVSGAWLSAEDEVTLPFTPESYYGFALDCNVAYSEQTPAVSAISEDWFDAVVENGKLRVRALKENTGSERSASFNLTVGETSKTITVKQQGLADVGTVDFGGLKWMDRVIGATLPAVQANANDMRSYGYFYQWGRNIPFPATGAVETVEGQMTPEAANESHKFIVYAEGTWDWNSNGIEGGVDESGAFTGKWENVGASPCPEGWRLPTYNEIADMMVPYQDCFIFAGGKQTRDEFVPGGGQYKISTFGTGANNFDPMGLFVLKRKTTDEAYHLRLLWTNAEGTKSTQGEIPSWTVNGLTMYNITGKDNQVYMKGGKNIFRINRLPADKDAEYENVAAAKEIWAAGEASSEGILFPCAGRRMETGEAVETDNAAFYWTGDMFKGYHENSQTANVHASGLLFFRPAGRFQMFAAPQYYYDNAVGTFMNVNTEILGYRNQAMPVRCVKK